MANKVYNMADALNLIKSGDTIATSGFGLSAYPEEVAIKLEEKFLKEGAPNNLTLIHGAGQGNFNNRGTSHFAHEGFLSKVILGHIGASPKMGDIIFDNKVQAWNLPQGTILKMFRARINGAPGEITKVGLKTYIDPRIEGGKMNTVTKDNIVEVVTLKGEEYLLYPAPKIDVGIIRGTVADTDGNISIDEESLPADIKLIAMAAKASGGKVIAQVKHIAPAGSLMTNRVHVPGIFVDAVVQCENPKENHTQTMITYYDQTLSGETYVALSNGSTELSPLDAKKVIARRCAYELVPSAIVNLGVGTPEFVSNVAAEEGVSDQLMLTAESGVIGGIVLGGLDFGSARNAMAKLDQITQFDFYDGNGLDVTFLGLAQTNQKGDVNVSKFGPKMAGCGGFINISQNTKNLVYCGTFTAGGLKETFGNGKMSIVQEGKSKKFMKEVEQVTFSGEFAVESGQNVLYVTERAVFKLTDQGLTLIEIAPGIDLEKDVLGQMEFRPAISPDLKLMDEAIFGEGLMGLKAIIDSKKMA